jgi:NADH dehydrogenase
METPREEFYEAAKPAPVAAAPKEKTEEKAKAS